MTSLPSPFPPYTLMTQWEPGIVKCSTQASRSYTVTMANGSTLRGNRSHIRPTGENIHIQNNIPSDEPLTALNDVCSTIPSTSRDNCEHTTLPSDAPVHIPQLRCPKTEAPLHRSSRLVKPPDRLDL